MHTPSPALIRTLATAAGLACLAGPSLAAPVVYKIDPTHTFPSFEADHMGISVWRGKFNKSSGSVRYDKADGSGSLEVTIDPASIDFGQDQLNVWARGKDLFDIKKHPKVRYQGRFASPVNGVPTQIEGELTLHGVTKPVTLKINSLKCIPHPMLKRELCGADASATFQRDEFGMDVGKDYKFDMTVALRIQVEAVAEK